MGSTSIKRFFMAFIAFAFFFISACSSGDDGPGTVSGLLDGTWYMDDFELQISGNNYLLKFDGENETKGTVTYNASTFEFIITHEWYGKNWVAVPASVSAKVWGNYTLKGEVSAFSDVYRDFGDGPESYDWFNGEWVRK